MSQKPRVFQSFAPNKRNFRIGTKCSSVSLTNDKASRHLTDSMDEELEFGISLSVQFAPVDRAIRVMPFLWSALAHAVLALLLLLLIVVQRSRPVMVPSPKAERAEMVRVEQVVAPSASGGLSVPNAQKKTKRSGGKIRPSDRESAMGVAAIRERARRETVAIVQNFKFRTTYGFSPNPKYELPVQTSGKYPAISPDELPPRYEQYLIVEITIDSDGRVIDARITAGETDTRVASKVLSAVRQFKYRPATKEGIPIPSQTDLVIHIPT
jgi:TonB family protein